MVGSVTGTEGHFSSTSRPFALMTSGFPDGFKVITSGLLRTGLMLTVIQMVSGDAATVRAPLPNLAIISRMCRRSIQLAMQLQALSGCGAGLCRALER